MWDEVESKYVKQSRDSRKGLDVLRVVEDVVEKQSRDSRKFAFVCVGNPRKQTLGSNQEIVERGTMTSFYFRGRIYVEAIKR